MVINDCYIIYGRVVTRLLKMNSFSNIILLKYDEDGKKIDQVLSEIAKLIIRLDKSSKKSRRDKNLVEKITEIRDLIQDAVLDAKLKKSVAAK